MCMALYLASDRPLPLIEQREIPKDALSSPARPREAQRFHTALLRPEQEVVRSHFSLPHVLYAGSYEGCGCGFNFGRDQDAEDDEGHLIAARESVAELARYVQDSRVREIYSCWFDDESKPTALERTVTLDALTSQEFFFREQELVRIDL